MDDEKEMFVFLYYCMGVLQVITNELNWYNNLIITSSTFEITVPNKDSYIFDRIPLNKEYKHETIDSNGNIVLKISIN